MRTLPPLTSSAVRPRPILTAVGALAALVLVPAAQVTAHTETDVVAIPAAEHATVRLAPTHGCGDSPTVSVRTRLSIPGAEAQPVDGWTHTTTPDDAGHVVMEWRGGVLPADQAGAFPVAFTTPDTVGQLLTFPFIQTCENGEELAWIDGDPASEHPAPRVLVLPAGWEPAATIDDVPADAPGRDLLTSIADVDNPAATTVAPATTATPATTPATAAPTTVADTAPPSTSPATGPAPTTELPPASPASTTPTTAPATSGPETSVADGSDDGGGSGTTIALTVATLVVIGSAAIGAVAWRRRSNPT